jgi:hypothetical protein
MWHEYPSSQHLRTLAFSIEIMHFIKVSLLLVFGYWASVLSSERGHINTNCGNSMYMMSYVVEHHKLQKRIPKTNSTSFRLYRNCMKPVGGSNVVEL